MNKENLTLKEEFKELVVRNVDEGYSIAPLLEMVVTEGLETGAISQLVYTKDIVEFFDRHNLAIRDKVDEIKLTLGVEHIQDILDNYVEIPLSTTEKDLNKELLVWLVCEELAYEELGNLED